jgi:bifunctional dihydroflavonol 4-reductase/flavanone 4-reductase
MSGTKGPVVVTGASGFVGTWLVMKLLQAGYTVRATVRDPCKLSNPSQFYFDQNLQT